MSVIDWGRRRPGRRWPAGEVIVWQDFGSAGLAAPSSIAATWRVEMQFSAGVWTDVHADVLVDQPITWNRGSQASGPADRIATAGRFEFSLRNDDGNSGGLLGYYSPGHANCRTGFTYGIPVRLIGTFAAIDYPLWRGRLRVIDPEPGTSRGRRTHCMAQDCIADLAEAKVRDISPQVNQTEDQLLTAVLGAVATEAQPAAVSFDPGLDVVPYGFANLGAGSPALSAMSDAVVSALGWLYVTGAGTLVYENRHTRSAKTSAHTFSADSEGEALTVQSSMDGVYNRIRVTYHQKDVDAAATTVLYAAPSPTAVAPGQMLTIWGTYVDPTNTLKLIGGTNVIDGVLTTTDYTANGAADGSGLDVSANVLVTATGFASAAKFVISNSGSVMAYVTPQIRGRGIYDNAPQTVESFLAESYGDRPFELDLPFQNSGSYAQDMADYLLSVFAQRRLLSTFAIPANLSVILMTQALSREIGDVITLSETVTGVTAVTVAIQGVEGAITGGFWLTMTWFHVPQADSHSFILDDAVFGVLDTGVLGYA